MRKIKISDIGDPNTFEDNIGIKIKDEKHFVKFMRELEKNGWKWGSGLKPTQESYDCSCVYVYLYKDSFMCRKHPCAIITHSTYFIFRDGREQVEVELDEPSVHTSDTPSNPSGTKNNDGRNTCYWCSAPCKQVQGITNTYNICTKCGK